MLPDSLSLPETPSSIQIASRHPAAPAATTRTKVATTSHRRLLFLELPRDGVAREAGAAHKDAEFVTPRFSVIRPIVCHLFLRFADEPSMSSRLHLPSCQETISCKS